MTAALRAGGVCLVDFDELQLGPIPRRLQVLPKLRVLRHLLEVFSRVPHVDYHHAIVGSRTGVRDAPRLHAGYGMLQLSIV
jgi:hypothetical protein